jgi:hypothetical protein
MIEGVTVNLKQLLYAGFFAINTLCVNVALAEAVSDPSEAPSNGVLPVVSGTTILTISGGGNYWSRQNFGGGETAVISAVSDSGESLPDGQYRYEYRELMVETPLTPQAVAKGADPERSRRPQGGSRVIASGRFEVVGGTIIYQ